MSPDRDPGRFQDDPRDVDEFEDDSPRSIFSALWFRALLAVLVLGVLAAIAVPYVLDFATTPALKGGAAKSPTPVPSAAPAAPVTKGPVTPPAPAPAAVATAAPVAPPADPPSPPPVPRAKPEAPAPPAAKSMLTKTVPPKPIGAKPPAVVARAVETPKPAAKAPEPAAPAASKAATPSAGGTFWVQVGAFKDAGTAKQVAARLRGQGLRVEESTATVTAAAPPAPAAAKSATDRYDVVVSGAAAADVDAKLASRGMTGEATSGGIVVRPSLALRDAVALSRDLADSGLSVQVRRVGGPAPSPAPAPPPAVAQTLHRVRVGGYPDRATAAAAMKQLEDKGYKAFITPGGR